MNATRMAIYTLSTRYFAIAEATVGRDDSIRESEAREPAC